MAVVQSKLVSKEKYVHKLFDAVKRGDIEDVKFYIRTKNVDPNTRDENGDTPIIVAVRKRFMDFGVFRALKSLGSDPRKKDKQGRDAFHNYLFFNVKFYTLRGVIHPFLPTDLQVTDNEGNSYLHSAINKYNIDAIEELIEEGSAIGAVNHDGETALHIAVKNLSDDIDEIPKENLPSKSHKCIRMLIRRGSPLSARNKDGNTPVHLIAEKGCSISLEYVMEVLDEDFDVFFTKNNAGKTPLDVAKNDKIASMIEEVIASTKEPLEKVPDDQGVASKKRKIVKSSYNLRSEKRRA